MDEQESVDDPKPHRKLRVWQAAMELTDAVYGATRRFPAAERFALANQMQRAAVSVPSNIAEGAARASNAECLHLLHAARGSLAELGTQVEIARRRGYVPPDRLEELTGLMNEVGRTLQGLIAYRLRQGPADKEPRRRR